MHDPFLSGKEIEILDLAILTPTLTCHAKLLSAITEKLKVVIEF